ncbi:MAG: T9SS type A sorting domain-containing protein [Gemmatimonadetes bacterium]|nr:T9SS type A sorting domain-containing protein [Gemmatimonadota bacterium]
MNNGPAPYYVMGGTQDNGTDKWSGTTTWANGLGADGMVCNIDPINGTNVYAEIQFGDHRKSTNSGVGFSSINTGITGSAQWVTPVAQDQTDGDILFTETSSGIFRTTNGGGNWTLVNGSGQGAVWLDVSRVDPDLVYAVDTASGGTVRRSLNGGTSWSNVSVGFPFSNGTETKILAHPTDVNTVFVTFSSYSNVAQVAMSTDQGSSWTAVDGDLPNIPVFSMAVNPSNPTDWYIGTDLGVWMSTNGGVNWTPAGTGMPNAAVDDLEIQDSLQLLVAGTHGRGAWELSISTAPVSSEITSAPLARNLMLDRPWPNPVRDRTILRYAAHSDAPVSLRVYDVKGRLVSDLEDLSRGDGIIRTTPWFTDDVPAGVYFAVLEAGSQRVTQKVTVLK